MSPSTRILGKMATGDSPRYFCEGIEWNPNRGKGREQERVPMSVERCVGCALRFLKRNTRSLACAVANSKTRVRWRRWHRRSSSSEKKIEHAVGTGYRALFLKHATCGEAANDRSCSDPVSSLVQLRQRRRCTRVKAMASRVERIKMPSKIRWAKVCWIRRIRWPSHYRFVILLQVND